MSEGVDYSFARPNVAALKAAGKTFAVRYLSTSGKGLTVSELAALLDHGVDVATVFEGGSQGVLFGGTQGGADARFAEDQVTALGLPASQPVYFAVDFDMQPAQFPLLDAYLRAAASILGADRVGVYGSFAVIEHVRLAGVASWFWQTYAWSGGRIADGIHLLQYLNGQTIGGGAVDLCRAYAADFGQHPKPAAAAITLTAATITETDDTEMLSQEAQTFLGDLVAAAISKLADDIRRDARGRLYKNTQTGQYAIVRHNLPSNDPGKVILIPVGQENDRVPAYTNYELVGDTVAQAQQLSDAQFKSLISLANGTDVAFRGTLAG